MIRIKEVKSDGQQQTVYNIRREVFGKEQGVDEMVDRDQYDDEAFHVLAYDNHKAVGCGRIVLQDKKAKLGRIAVLKEARKSGIGQKIVEALVDIAKEHHIDLVYLHSQITALPFYQRLGFNVVGDEFDEAGITHIRVEKRISEQVIVIGIAGGTGSGKSTLMRRLKEALGDEVLTLTHDYYYKCNDHLTMEERRSQNYDHPDAFDTDMMIEHIKMLKKGQPIERPSYDFTMHTRAKEVFVETPKKVIIVEGILIFENPNLRKLFDIKVFVDTDSDVRIIRRILRDVRDRGRDLDSVIQQYLGSVKLMHEEFVEPSKRYADLIIPEGGYNKVAYSMLLDKIRLLLAPEKDLNGQF